MSAQQSSPAALSPAGNSDGDGGSDVPAGGPHEPMETAATGDLSLATADLANLLANGAWSESSNDLGGAEAAAYDGHVALALDTGVLPDIDSTLDLLTSSHHLFDVPALDVSSTPDDTPST